MTIKKRGKKWLAVLLSVVIAVSFTQLGNFSGDANVVMAATLAVIFAGTYSFSAKMGDTSLVKDKKAVSRFIERTNEKLSSFFDFSNWEVTKNDK